MRCRRRRHPAGQKPCSAVANLGILARDVGLSGIEKADLETASPRSGRYEQRYASVPVEDATSMPRMSRDFNSSGWGGAHVHAVRPRDDLVDEGLRFKPARTRRRAPRAARDRISAIRIGQAPAGQADKRRGKFGRIVGRRQQFAGR